MSPALVNGLYIAVTSHLKKNAICTFMGSFLESSLQAVVMEEKNLYR